MRKPISRLLIFVLTFFIACSMTIKPAQASIWDWLKAQFRSKEASDNMQTSLLQEGVSGEKHVTETTSNVMNVINLHILGAPEEEEATVSSMLRESVGPGLIGVVNSGIVAMYDPPASSITYMADVLQNAKIIPQAQAQGLGFAALDPILETWKQFRNVAYLFFVIIFLVIGFMIMFRAKIGQAAITVQQAIPSIIVAMLAVTFSYAIAGFLIDLMYLLMFMLVTLFQGEGRDLISGNIFTLIGAMFNSFGDTVRDALTNLMAGLLGDGFVVAALGWLSSLSAIMIIGLAILISAFKIFLELLKSYIAIILQVVFAPIILMVGAFPGKNTFLSWIKNLTGNLVMWPLILICLLVNRMLTSSGYTFNDASVGGFMPPYLLGSGQGAAFPALVGIGILIVIPEIMKEAKKKLGVEEGIMGNLAEAAFKRIKQGEVTLPVAGAIGGSALGGAKSAAHLLADKDSVLRRSGGIAGIMEMDGKEREDVMTEIRNVLGSGYKNQKTGEMVGGVRRGGQRGYKVGQKVRQNIDRMSEGRFWDAENTEDYMRRILENQESEKEAAKQAEEEKNRTKEDKIQEDVGKASIQDY
jgi:hypothetical protein